MDVDRAFAEARARLFASIDLRVALAHRKTAALGEHHRRALGQRFRKASRPPQ